MKIIFDEPIDIIYKQNLKDIADYYKDTIEFALKMIIGLKSAEIKGFKKGIKMN